MSQGHPVGETSEPRRILVTPVRGHDPNADVPRIAPFTSDPSRRQDSRNWASFNGLVTPITVGQELLMRSLDVVGAILLIVIFFPIGVIGGLLIWGTSAGPVFYKQRRVGKNGRIFVLYKFRTMVDHAEKVWGFMPASENDVRVTTIGRILRRSRIDELPQLLNVFKGDMSLVGPRPENLYRVSIHEALRGVRLGVKPGITGLAQIRSLYDLKPMHKLKYDYLYIKKRSFRLNLYILAKTIPVILRKTGW